MNELALFAGAGGGILGGHLLGWRTVCAVEWEAYPASVLCARQNDRFLPSFPIWDDVQTFDGKPWEGIVDVVSGGFPCQDISAAGRGGGITASRSSMWKHMARIIGEVQPKYAFVENSPMLTTRGLGTVLGDLASLGFDAEWGVLSAADVGANHLRERIWIVAKNTKQPRLFPYTMHNRNGWGEQQPESIKKEVDVSNTNGKGGEWLSTIQADRCSRSINGENNASNAKESASLAKISNVANSSLPRLSSCNQPSSRPQKQVLEEQSWGGGDEFGDRKYWEVEPNVGRVVNGMASRVDRLKAIGNGQVPLCAATAWKLLKERIENGKN
jgi:DNA (cytosine-5)-methyltransferase 1